ncbi:MAG: cobalamin biosynthesis protein CobW [Clostridia bacterium]|nr:cobalamin biosynthesis protein CobW [Clostridia bacterium]
MTKIDIFSGFLGAGKTTLIKKLIKEAYVGEQLVLIENEFGEIGIDGGFMQDAGINITEMNSGCICCSLVGDFAEALQKVINQFHPDRILIEPSGVGKLSDVIKAVMNAETEGAVLNGFTTVADAKKCKMYIRNFGEFFNNQIQYASCIVLSHTGGLSDDKIAEAVSLLREINPKSAIVTTPWDELTGAQILSAMEQKNTLESEIEELKGQIEEDEDDDDEECECHHHHHHDDEDEDEHHHHHHHDEDDDEECECHHHHHHDDDDEDEDGHHHHDEDDDEGEHEHHHHHPHHHHHGHDADEVFTSWGVESTKRFTKDEILSCLKALDSEQYGLVLRAKGIVPATDGTWIHYDYVPGEPDVRSGSAGITGRLCVIGSKLNESALAELFGV